MFLLRDKDILFLGERERERERFRNYLGFHCDLGRILGNIRDSIATLGKELGKDLGGIGIRKGIRKLSLGRGLGI